MPYIMMGWMVGSVFFMVRFLYGIWYVRRLKTASVQVLPDQWLNLLEQLKLKLGIPKIIALMESPNVTTPVVIGHLKPIILFPLGMLSGLSHDQVEAILVHELSHIKRHDFIINIAQSFVEVVFYFNPFVWFISHTIRVEREHTCDDQTLSLGIEPHLYVHTLADVYEYQLTTPRMSMAFATKEKFTLKRIQRLMKTQMNNNYNNKSLAGVLLASALLTLIYIGQMYPGASATEQSNLALVPAGLFASSDIQQALTNEFTEPKLEAIEALVSKVEVVQEFVEPVVAPDTIDTEAFEQHKKEFDVAMENLKSSREWQKMEELSKEMAKMNIELMEDISPLIDEQMLEAMEEVKISEELVQEMVEMAHEMADATNQEEVLEQVRETMLLHEKELQLQMEELNRTLSEIDLESIQEQAELARVMVEEAQINAQELQEVAIQAQKIAEEARVYAEEVEEFHTQLVDMLIDDGYIKSEDDIEQLEVEDGVIYLNGDKLDKKDQKKYIDLHNKYFDGGEFRLNVNE